MEGRTLVDTIRAMEAVGTVLLQGPAVQLSWPALAVLLLFGCRLIGRKTQQRF